MMPSVPGSEMSPMPQPASTDLSMLLGRSQPYQGSSEEAAFAIQEQIIQIGQSLKATTDQVTALAQTYPAFQSSAAQIVDALESLHSILNQGMLDAITDLRSQEPQAPPGLGGMDQPSQGAGTAMPNPSGY